MAVAYWRLLDQALAEPRVHTPRARDGSERFRRGSLPPRRRDGLSTFLRRALFAGPVGFGGHRTGLSAGWRVRFSAARRPALTSAGWPRRLPSAVRRQPAVPSMRGALDALGRVHHNVSADQDGLLHKRPSLPTR